MEYIQLLEYAVIFITLYILVFFIILFLRNLEKVHKIPKPPKKLPKISILIPAFNEQRTIAKAIKSVLDADYPKHLKEIIVINDGSTDDTLTIARRYLRYGIRVINKNNSGKAKSLNYALKRASGELIVTLDGDSYIEYSSLKQMVGYFKDPEVAAVTSVMKVHRPKGLLRRIQSVEYMVMVVTRKIMSFLDSINVTPGPLSMFRKKIFDLIGNYDEKNILEDQEMAFRIQKHNYKIESSMSATVHTIVPRNLNDLVRQRLRWYRGTLRNIIKYRGLITPRYGDFGIIVLPIAIFSIFAIFSILLFTILAFIRGDSVFSIFLQTPQALIYGFSGIHLLLSFMFLLSLFWIYLSLKQIREESISLPWMVVYVLIYGPLITLFWLIALLQEIAGKKLKW